MEDTHNSKEETLAIILKKLEKNEENLNKRLDSLTKEITIAKRENYDHFSNLEKKISEYEKSMSFLSNQFKNLLLLFLYYLSFRSPSSFCLFFMRSYKF